MARANNPEEVPEGYNKVNFFILVKGGADAFIRFVENVFDATENKQIRIPDKDGLIIHAEISVGDAKILTADAKADWPFTPAFPQVYVSDAQAVLERATQAGARMITPVSDFYGGKKLARFQDPWGNIWWLFEQGPALEKLATSESSTSWHQEKPSLVYTTLLEAMRNLKHQ